MLYPLWRLVRVMTLLQHLVVSFTVLGIPASLDLFQGWGRTGYCPSCLDFGQVAFYLIWYGIAIVVMSLAFRSDRSKVDKEFEEVSSDFHGRISQAEEKITRNLSDVQYEVECLQKRADSVENFMRRHLSLRLPAMLFIRDGLTVQVGFSAEVSGITVETSSSLRKRLSRLVMRQWRRFSRWFLRVVVDWRGFAPTNLL